MLREDSPPIWLSLDDAAPMFVPNGLLARLGTPGSIIDAGWRRTPFKEAPRSVLDDAAEQLISFMMWARINVWGKRIECLEGSEDLLKGAKL